MVLGRGIRAFPQGSTLTGATPRAVPHDEVNEEKAGAPHQAARKGGRSRHEPAAWSGRVAGPAAALRRKGRRGNAKQDKDHSRRVLERGQVNENGETG